MPCFWAEVFSTGMSGLTYPQRQNRVFIAVFIVALVAHFYFATLNWSSGFMPGHEFRQAQTAIVSHYIDVQNNFSLFYETPILGKPWVSILLEVPIYEWSVVGLSRATGMPHFVAARTVSLACFYLSLPAMYLLLGRLGLARERRLLVLALILACPVYIFYSRAFLMESMELMCCAWFLIGFVRTMDERRWGWLGLTILAGTGAALIKSATFAVWLVPGAAYGCWLLWRDVRAKKGWLIPLKTALWGTATVGVALGALRWWISVTDPIKEAHASANLFTSTTLSQGNWGLLDFGARVSPKVWGILLQRWQEAIANPWIIGGGLVAGLVLVRARRAQALGLAAIFFFAQLMFPFAYAYQDYYYYACAVFLLAAFGVILLGVLDSRLPRWCGWLIVAIPFVAQVTTYWNGYRTDQVLKSEGGFNFTEAIRDFSPKDSVIIVAGADWGAIIPFYSQRKALMIRNGLEYDAAYLHRATNELAGEDVSALVLVGPLRENSALLNLIAKRFDFDSSSPTFSQGNTDIYFARPLIEKVQAGLRASDQYPALTIGSPPKGGEQITNRPARILPEQARTSFAAITPAPDQGYFAQGANLQDVSGERVITAHPDCEVWLRPAAGSTRIQWDFGLMPIAYEREGDKTDGVEFLITGEAPDGSRRQIYRRVLDPAHQPNDRGHQRESISYQPVAGEVLIFSNRPNLSYSYDWAYWIRIEVK